MTTTNKTANKTRKPSIKATDLALQALMQGVDSLDPILANHAQPVIMLGKVRETFVKHGKATEEIDAKIAMFESMHEPGVKGRKPVKSGDSRKYKVQQLKADGDLFIRLNANTLGVSKGDELLVTFGPDSISVTVADRADLSVESSDDENDDEVNDQDDVSDDADLAAAE